MLLVQMNNSSALSNEDTLVKTILNLPFFYVTYVKIYI